MKKRLMQLLAFILIFNIVVCSSRSCFISYAASVDSQYIVTSHEGTYGSLVWGYSTHYKTFYLQNQSGISSSSRLSPKYFFNSNDGVTFDYVDGSELITLILNRGLGLILEPTQASNIIRAFFNAIGDPSVKDMGALYCGNTFLGYCLDDITGRYYKHLVQGQSYTITAQNVNNVGNFYYYQHQQNATNNSSSVKYFNYRCMPTVDSANVQNLYVYNYDNVIVQNIYKTFWQNGTATGVQLNPRGLTSYQKNVFVISDSTLFDSLVSNFNLSNGDTLDFESIAMIYLPNISGTFYDSNGNVIESINLTELDSNYPPPRIGIFYSMYGYITIYRSFSDYQSLNQQTLNQNVYYSSIYIEYEQNIDNSDNSVVNNNTTVIDTSTNQTADSTNINNNSYEEINNDTTNIINNGTIDNSTIIDNSTTIINNYYPDVPQTDPDNPTPDPDDPDSILDALLAAILKFFQALSRIIATVFTGIVEGLTIVVEAAGSIIEAIPNLTELFSSLLGWLPAPIPEVIGLGISICIIAAVFKFIRG